MQEDTSIEPPPSRAGHVALVGLPNVGKSTLLNALLGEKLSIVTARAQTTREPVTGILSTAHEQAIFVDTPGLLEPRYALHESMLTAALATILDADLILLLLDAGRPNELPTGSPLEALQQRSSDVLPVLNKVDAAQLPAVTRLEDWCARHFSSQLVPISALTGQGISDLRERILHRLPPNPFFYPPDDLATQPVRFFVAEFIRETIFEQYEQELPYASVVRVEEYREGSDPLYIRATIYLERDRQKAIIIGHGGNAIRKLGERSREKIEAFLDQRIYLDLWVKTLPNWKKKRSALAYLGFRLGEPRSAEPAP